MTPDLRAICAALGLFAVACFVLSRLHVIARWSPMRAWNQRVIDAELDLIREQEYGEHDPLHELERLGHWHAGAPKDEGFGFAIDVTDEIEEIEIVQPHKPVLQFRDTNREERGYAFVFEPRPGVRKSIN